MPLYSYKAVNPDGRTVLGRIDAVNLVDLDMRLRRMELDLVRGAPVGNRRRAARPSATAACLPATVCHARN